MLRTPWFCLHPCETGSRMQLLLHPENGEGVHGKHPEDSKKTMQPQLKYLLGWYSMVASVVQLPCPATLWMYDGGSSGVQVHSDA